MFRQWLVLLQGKRPHAKACGLTVPACAAETRACGSGAWPLEGQFAARS